MKTFSVSAAFDTVTNNTVITRKTGWDLLAQWSEAYLKDRIFVLSLDKINHWRPVENVLQLNKENLNDCPWTQTRTIKSAQLLSLRLKAPDQTRNLGHRLRPK